MKTLPFSPGLITLATALAVIALGLTPPSTRAQSASESRQLYTCSMHPQILLDHPGDCPICGMKLVPVQGNAATDIVIDPVTIQKMNLKTDVVRTGPVRREIRAVGIVAFNEEGLQDITTKYEGWIEKLFVNTTWARVHAGDPLFEIYSPDLYNAQLNYLIAVRSEGSDGGPLTHAAQERLRLFDVPEEFVNALARSGEAQRTYVFRAPADGVVMEKAAVQGMMVKPGERIYRLADLSTVWVNAQIYEQDLAFVRPGQAARVRSTYGGDRVFAGKVDLLLPEVEPATRTAPARVVLPNPGLSLKPGMFVDVRFETELTPSAVLVPDMAVLRSGEHDTVFVALAGGVFQPREIKLGARTGDNCYEVLAGLAAGERVVTSGQFLLDSESQLREAIQKMLHGTGSNSAPSATPPGEHRVKYFKSTMNPGEISDHPGKDSMGMDMVPVYDDSGAAVGQR